MPTVKEDLLKMKIGWVGKPKGTYQVLWERGFLDPNNLNQYTMDGRKDQCGIHQPHTSLKYLLGSCRDFQEEESLLQTMGRKLGVTVDRTPKCHCELAGEGIEYSWGCAKNYFRCLPLREKKSKETFKSSVRKSISNKDVITVQRVRAFSRRARQYTLAYYAMQQQQQEDASTTINEQSQLTAVKIEQMVKQFKTHRCAIDFDGAFIRAVIIKKEE